MQRNPGRYRRRRWTSLFVLGLCWGAAALGLTILFIILGTLVYRGLGSLSPQLFTLDIPPPGEQGGGLRNAIIGSLIITTIGTLIGTPIGILAGTYMAEYGRHSRITAVIRFVNDILLSAPSIVTGLFIYEIMIRPKIQGVTIPLFGYNLKIDPFGHFSALAGSAALAVIVIPIVVRTTENMLLLVPNQLREAASAIGMPRALVIRYVAYKAAMAGIITGVLLAIARISGETAPLILTVLGNQFLSFDVNGEMSSLPQVIFNFALSPYERWKDLAWTAALLITAAVLLLSIAARWLGSRGVIK